MTAIFLEMKDDLFLKKEDNLIFALKNFMKNNSTKNK